MIKNEEYRGYIEDLSRKTRYIRATLEKVDRLLEILEWINNHERLGSLLSLKGGTAINAVIFDFPRLSVDIDLDFTENISREEMMEARLEVHELIVSYLESNEYKINLEKSKNVHALDSLVVEYLDVKGNLDNIKIEINYMNRVHILETKKTKLESNVFKTKRFVINHVDSVEIYAAKFCALFSRTTARDLYDVYTLAKNNFFDEREKELLRKSFFLEYIAINDYKLEDLDLKKLDKLTMSDVRTKLLPTLNNRNPKNVNIDEMKEVVSYYLRDFMTPTQKEKEFYDEFQKGLFRPELLFDDEEIIDRIRNHPMVLWKLEHIFQ